MDCTNCKSKICKVNESCGAEKFDSNSIINEYKLIENQQIVQAAAELVDNNKAGTLSRLQEIIEFSKSMNYKHLGIAFCFGMEKDIKIFVDILKENKFKISAISCSVGGLTQDNVNENSCIHKISCNPIGQAQQINSENVDFTIIAGICLGHDILLQRNLKSDFTTFIVKDRIFKHNTLLALQSVI